MTTSIRIVGSVLARPPVPVAASDAASVASRKNLNIESLRNFIFQKFFFIIL